MTEKNRAVTLVILAFERLIGRKPDLYCKVDRGALHNIAYLLKYRGVKEFENDNFLWHWGGLG